MNIHAVLEDDRRLKLAKALLLYQEEGERGQARPDGALALATIHDVRERDGRPEIAAGRCLRVDELADLAREINGQSGKQRILLPAPVLYTDGQRLLWWRPARRRPVFFHTGRAAFDQATNGKNALWPALLFRAEPQKLSVWAVAGDERPELGTPVFRAPLLNIYGDGLMCAGTAKLPLEVGTSHKPFERLFFETTFTHSNIRGKLTAFKGGHDALWTELVRPELESFDPAWLMAVDGTRSALTVREVLNQ